MGGEPRLPVCGGVGVQREPQTAVGSRRRADRQALHGTGGEVAHGAGEAGEVQGAVEGLDVDHRAGQRRVGRLQGQIAAEVGLRVALVAADRADLQHHPAQQLRPGVLRPHGDAQRQHVDRHGGGAQGGRAAPVGQRQTQHHVLGAGEPVLMTGGRGDDELGPGRFGGARRPGEPVQGARGEAGDPVQEVAGGGTIGIDRCGLGGVPGHPLRPEGAVLGVLRTGQIRRLVVGQLAQRGEPALGRGLVGDGGRVELGDPPADQRERVGVDGYVVDALVPPVAALADAEQRLRHQPVGGGEVHRPGQVLPHPRLGLLRRHFEPVDDEFGVRDALHRCAVGLGDPYGQRVRLAHGPPERLGEQVPVERPVDLHAVGRVQLRAGGGQLVRVVDARLGGQEGQRSRGRAAGVRCRRAGRAVRTLMHVCDDSPEGQRTPGHQAPRHALR